MSGRSLGYSLLIACWPHLLAAQLDLDSLRRTNKDPSVSDSLRLLAYFDLVWDGYLFSDPDSAFILAHELRSQARAMKNASFVARASELMGASWYVRGELHKALRHYDTALTQHRRNGDREGMADVLTNMATFRSAMGERQEALRMYAEGMRLHEELHDSTSIANDLNAIGVIHVARGDHVRAAACYQKSLHIQELLGNARGVCTSRLNLGLLLAEQGDPSAALTHLRAALAIAQRLDDQHQIGKCLEEVGSCEEMLGDTAAAFTSYDRSMTVRSAIDDLRGLINVRNRIGELKHAQGHTAEALELFEENARIAQEQELPWGLGYALLGKARVLRTMRSPAKALLAAQQAEEAATTSEDLSLRRDLADLQHKILSDLGRWREALLAHELSVVLNDSIMREENQRAVLHNEYRYAYEQEAKADSLAQALRIGQEEARTQMRLASERSRRNMALALGGLLTVVVVAIWQRARLLARTNASILQAQKRLLESERAREASEVRTRIARDVHDQLGSDLTKLVMLSTEAKALASEDPRAVGATALDIERVAAEANRSLGDIVWAIDPHHDSLAGLTERVREHCERMLKRSHIGHRIDCRHEGPDRSLDPATKRDLYLILREALNNALKYAQATHIEVSFLTSADGLRMMVKDDGIGLASQEQSTGHGLANMRARAERIGATFSVDGTDGTTVRLAHTLPPV